MRVTAVYARVSSGRQEQERTIESQLEEIRRYLALRGEEVAPEHIYVDDGWSGEELQRPRLDALRDVAGLRLIDRVVIYDPDRLARRFVDQQVVVEELERSAVQAEFVKGGEARTDEERMLLQVRGVFAEYERKKILERTRRGRLHRARQGAPPIWSNPPYGYRYLPRERNAGAGAVVLVEEVEAETVRQIFRWVADDGLRIRQVAHRLRERSIVTRGGRGWLGGTLGRMLRNRAYIGTAHHQMHEKVEPKQPRDPLGYRKKRRSSQRSRPVEEWIPVPVPAIVASDVFQRAQEKLDEHRRATAGQASHPHLLRGLLWCTACGRKLVARAARRSKTVYRAYDCAARDPFASAHAAPCPRPRVRADKIEQAVWTDLTNWIQQPRQLHAQLQALRDGRASLADAQVEETRHVERQVRLIDQTIKRLFDAYEAGAMPIEELRARRERLEEQRQHHVRRLEELAEAGRRQLRQHAAIQDIESLCARIRDGLDRCAFEDRRAIVQLLIERVDVGDGELSIHYVVPLGHGTASTLPTAIPGNRGPASIPTPPQGPATAGNTAPPARTEPARVSPRGSPLPPAPVDPAIDRPCHDPLQRAALPAGPAAG
jgi:site-specific DNA recombinase